MLDPFSCVVLLLTMFEAYSAVAIGLQSVSTTFAGAVTRCRLLVRHGGNVSGVGVQLVLVTGCPGSYPEVSVRVDSLKSDRVDWASSRWRNLSSMTLVTRRTRIESLWEEGLSNPGPHRPLRIKDVRL